MAIKRATAPPKDNNKRGSTAGSKVFSGSGKSITSNNLMTQGSLDIESQESSGLNADIACSLNSGSCDLLDFFDFGKKHNKWAKRFPLLFSHDENQQKVNFLGAASGSQVTFTSRSQTAYLLPWCNDAYQQKQEFICA